MVALLVLSVALYALGVRMAYMHVSAMAKLEDCIPTRRWAQWRIWTWPFGALIIVAAFPPGRKVRVTRARRLVTWWWTPERWMRQTAVVPDRAR
jgi:hypothetical protein